MLDITDGWHKGECNGTVVLLSKNFQVQHRGGSPVLSLPSRKVEMLT